MNRHVAMISSLVMVLAGPPVGAQNVSSKVGVIALDPVNVGHTVQNAPYSAEAVTEVTQALTDGNRIERRMSASVARDSRGRTRREQPAIALGSYVAEAAHPIVTITDPANGVHLTLNYESKIAFRSRPVQLKLSEADRDARGPVAFSAGPAMRSPEADQMVAESGSAAIIAARPPRGLPGEIAVSNRTIARQMQAGLPAVALDGTVHREQLDPRMIEGLRAEGTRSTMTIPAGALGNTLPIEVVSEQWYSPDLQVVLLTRRSDPRFGETLYRLTNIDRAEPAPELFTVPPDFRIEDMRQGSVMPLRPDG